MRRVADRAGASAHLEQPAIRSSENPLQPWPCLCTLLLRPASNVSQQFVRTAANKRSDVFNAFLLGFDISEGVLEKADTRVIFLSMRPGWPVADRPGARNGTEYTPSVFWMGRGGGMTGAWNLSRSAIVHATTMIRHFGAYRLPQAGRAAVSAGTMRDPLYRTGPPGAER